MKCDLCGKECRAMSGPITEKDSKVGEYTISDAPYFRCVSCDEVVYPVETARLLDRKRQEVEASLIRARSIQEFWSAAETAEFLGISRQALHKHARIRRGFICQTDLGGKTVYLRESVRLFKKTGDGRLPLVINEDESKDHATLKPVRPTLSRVAEEREPYGRDAK